MHKYLIIQSKRRIAFGWSCPVAKRKDLSEDECCKDIKKIPPQEEQA
jgi:hypothetical protein